MVLLVIKIACRPPSHQGFKDRGVDVSLVKNGTFINNFELFPSFGFNEGNRISDQHERRKRDLEPMQRAYKLEDTSRYTESFFGRGVEFIDFSATLSTSSDQFAIVPGYLQKEWQQDGRNYYRYEMDAPMVNFFRVMSANLEKKQVEHDGINIEVYYHKNHSWNVDRMIESGQTHSITSNKYLAPINTNNKDYRISRLPEFC
jgi:ABC-2 type transport system permease protein